MTDTIFAAASGPGKAAVAVIRISGSGAGPVLRGLIGGRLPPPRRASVRRLREPSSGETLDQSLVLWLPAPASFTGEDQAELHIHGGTAVRAAVTAVLARQPGCRPAEAGEFTRRAFLNGKLDLTAVEGLADLIDAETEAQRRQALRQAEGALATAVAGWRDRLTDALAACEAELDFSDESDVPEDVVGPVSGSIAAVRGAIAEALAAAERGERLREGFTVVIAGPPNAGKSSLLNAIARRDVALVSPVPGTTRDAIEVRSDLGGLPVVFVDTAGLRQSRDAVELAGMARARRRMEQADLLLWLEPADSTRRTEPPPTERPVLVVATKADLAPGRASGADLIPVSALTGSGIPELLARVSGLLSEAAGGLGDPVVTRERQRLDLSDAVACLDRALDLAGGPTELVAEDLRLALRALERLTGRVHVEEVLGRIFSSFCIGK